MKIPTAAHIGAMVREYRELRGWSMTEFSAKLRDAGLSNFHPTTVSRLEKGKRPLKIDEIYVVAHVLRANIDDLIVIPYEEWEYAYSDVEDNRRIIVNFAQRAAYWRWRLEDLIVELLPQAERLEDFVKSGKVPEDRIGEVHELIEAARAEADISRIDHWSDYLNNLESDEERVKFGQGLG